MPRIAIMFAVLAGLTGCTGPTYTIEGATQANANARAERYCYERDAKARFEGVVHRNDAQIEIYRCVPPQIISATG